MYACVRVFLLTLGASVLLSAWPCRGLAAQGRAFTVRDSIEMEKFTDPWEVTSHEVKKFSPNGRYFIVVTQRGIVETNRLRSTIWLFDVNAERAFVRSESPIKAPKPVVLATIIGSTTNVYDSANDSLETVRDLQWSEDGRRVVFRGRHGSSDWTLFSLDVHTKHLHRLSLNGQDVSGFTQSRDVTVYAVELPYKAEPPASSFSGDGMSLASLLFPAYQANTTANSAELWFAQGGKARPIIDPRSGKPVRVNDNRGALMGDFLSLSPDGHYLVTLRVVDSFPDDWAEYEPLNFPNLRIVPPQPGEPAHVTNYSSPEEFMLIDLRKRTIEPMVEAPLGRDLGWYGNQPRAVWCRNSLQVLLQGVFLPLSNVAKPERDRRVRQPAIVAFNTKTHEWTAVAAAKQSTGAEGGHWQISTIEWNEAATAVTVRYSPGGPATEDYTLTRGRWERSDRADTGTHGASENESPVAHPLIVSLQEDLNIPPALFAAASSRDTPKKIWDPNPQLQDIALGDAEIYNWKDRFGRDVKGVLVKPPHFVPGRRYPLVIEARMAFQDHFVIDGQYSTATGARAMAAGDLMVLQAGEPFLPADDVVQGSSAASLAGWEAAIDKLVSDGLVDANRVGIIGFSRTCSNVLYALAKRPHLFAAATVANGFSYGFMQYLVSVDLDPKNVTDGQYLVQYGTRPFGSGLASYIRNNPILNIDKVTAPVRVETHKPLDMLYDWEVYASLRSLGKPVDLIVLPRATHVVSMPSDLLESQQGDVDWFRFWLQGYERPGAAAEYDRWHAMREQISPESSLLQSPIQR